MGGLAAGLNGWVGGWFAVSECGWMDGWMGVCGRDKRVWAWERAGW